MVASSAAGHLWRMPVRPHVSPIEPVAGDPVFDVHLQGGGQLCLWRCRQPVSDGRSQILHRPSAAELPGCLQASVGTHQLREWRVHGELHLHGEPFYGGRIQVTAVKWTTASADFPAVASYMDGGCLFLPGLTQISLFSRLSFFSGHASFSMYCMLFLVVSAGALYTLTRTCLSHTDINGAMSLALHPSPAQVRVGQAPPSHHPVLPDRHRRVRGSVQSVGLQTSLERRVGWSVARSFSSRFYSKFEGSAMQGGLKSQSLGH